MCMYLDMFISSMTGEIENFVDMCSMFHLENDAVSIKAVFKCTILVHGNFDFCHLALQLRLKASLSYLVPDLTVLLQGWVEKAL